MKPKVFVIQDSGKNLSPAREYGEIEVILHRDATKDAGPIALHRKLREFRKDDFLLLIGHPIFIGLAMHAVLQMYGSVNCLVWDKNHYCYNVEHAYTE
jgi:hypothetical protein